MKNIPFHKVANIFPLIHGKEFVELKTDIKANGVHEPIVMYQGQILDGRNRFRACQEVGVTPEFVEYEGADPVGYVLSLNLHRRHLNESQRAMVADKVANMVVGDNQHASIEATSQTDAALALNVSRSAVQRAHKVNEEGVPKLIEAVQDGKVSVSAAADVATLTEEEQVEVVARGEKEILQKAKEIRADKARSRKEERKAAIQSQADDIAAMDIPVIERKYHVISIDPPWPYEGGKENTYDPEARRVANPYPEMSIGQIADLQMPAADDSVLWLWTTHKFLPDSFELLNQWGFEYKATMVWDKQKIGMGHWLRMQCEFCLLAVKGNPVWDNTTVRDILSSPRREHSRKPDEFFTMVDEICTGAKIEYFSREKREGWDQVGNDKDKFAA